MVEKSEYDYLVSWSNELNSRADRVRNIIGDRHWLSDGYHKEAIVRDFLKRYLPVHLMIGTGFIKTSVPEDLCSPEIDILICDWSLHPAIFNESDIQIVPPASVIAYIQSKSSFSSSTLNYGLENIFDTQCAVLERKKIWRSICFADINRSFESFVDTTNGKISEFIKGKKVSDCRN